MHGQIYWCFLLGLEFKLYGYGGTIGIYGYDRLSHEHVNGSAADNACWYHKYVYDGTNRHRCVR